MDIKFGSVEETLGRLSEAVDDDQNAISILDTFASRIANKTLTTRQFVSSLIVCVEDSCIRDAFRMVVRGYYERIISKFIQSEAELSIAYDFLKGAYRRVV